VRPHGIFADLAGYTMTPPVGTSMDEPETPGGDFAPELPGGDFTTETPGGDFTLAERAEHRLWTKQRLRRELETRRANTPEAIRLRQERELQSTRGVIDEDGVLQGGLMAFIRHHRWPQEGHSEQGHGSGPRAPEAPARRP
jgi:hypothetical protein